MPRILYDPYVELGGQGAAIMLYSFLGMRGLTNLTTGLANGFADMDLSSFYQNSRASRFVGRILGHPRQTAVAKQQ